MYNIKPYYRYNIRLKNVNLNFFASTVVIYNTIIAIYKDKKFKIKFFDLHCCLYITSISLYIRIKNLKLNFLSFIYSFNTTIYKDKKFKIKFFILYCCLYIASIPLYIRIKNLKLNFLSSTVVIYITSIPPYIRIKNLKLNFLSSIVVYI